jgi:hypothetical protein
VIKAFQEATDTPPTPNAVDLRIGKG